MRPNFVIIGAQKAATTSLWRYLGQHPRVFMSPIKETNFFVAEMGWQRGVGWYESLFAPAAGQAATAIGEASPNYTLYPGLAGVPKRMSEVIPDARLVYVLRHPVERMVSSYLHSLTQGSESWPLERALFERSHYADTSRYAMQIERYLPHFDRSRLLIILSEDLEAKPAETLDRVLRFLELPPGWRPTDLGVRHHITQGKRVPRVWWRKLGGLVVRGRLSRLPVPKSAATSPFTTRALTRSDTTLTCDVRKRLEEMLRPDVERLREYLGEDFHGWGLLD
ncbi:MAG: sulfotransferase [Actinomycetota bacterium]|nr:sulfotransferase [Actinomycetota bacterium]